MKIKGFSLFCKIYPVLAVGFLLANLGLQYVFFQMFFINTGKNGDEIGYFNIITQNPDFSFADISNSFSQPYIFFGTLLNYVFNDVSFTNRFISLLCGIFLLFYLFWYFRKHKFFNFISGYPLTNQLTLFGVLFAVITIIRGHFVGTSDIISVTFAVPAFIILTEALKDNSNRNLWKVGLLFALAFTSRPTFLVVLLAYLLSVLFFSLR